jgi:hypothetical protein
VAAGALVATFVPSAVARSSASSGSGASTSAKAGDTYGNLWNVLPPGSNGNVTALDRAALGGSRSALTYDKSEDSIRASTAGVVGVRPIGWQNRPTFQQVISFFAHR